MLDLLLKKIYFLLVIIVFIVSTGCFNINEDKKSDITTTPENKTVSLYNWKEYTDLSVIKDFEKETGIKVILYEYETSEMMLAEVQANPGKYDIISVLGDMVPVMKDLKLLEQLDISRIPNYINVNEEFKKKPFYKYQGEYFVPNLWGTVGLVYNTKYVKEDVDSWKVLLDKKYKGKIALMDDPREAVGVLFKISGYSLNSKDPEELKMAEKNALLLKENGVKFGDTLDNVDKVIQGDLWIAEVYNGDFFYKGHDRKEMKFVNPKEGFNVWGDAYSLSYDAKNRDGAYKFLNYLLKPEISARFVNSFYYATSIDGAEKYINKKILGNPMIYPSLALLKKGEPYIDIGDTNKDYMRIFSSMK